MDSRAEIDKDRPGRMIVPPELDDQRVDKTVAVLAGVSRAVAREMVDGGLVKVDGIPVGARFRVSAGNEIEIPAVPAIQSVKAEEVEFGIAFEDEYLAVVEKPTGVVVHPGGGIRQGTLVAGLMHRYPSIEGVGSEGRWGIVHRLDRDTSGLMAVAKTKEAFEGLESLVAARKLKRTYLALASGVFQIPTGTVDAPIGTDPSDPRRKKVIPGGRASRTHYRVVREWEDEDVALLEVELETGRTHQIRVHLGAIGHPVIGDPWYGRPTRVSAPRTFLHAARLSFQHPITGDTVECSCSLPADLQAVLDGIGDAQNAEGP